MYIIKKSCVLYEHEYTIVIVVVAFNDARIINTPTVFDFFIIIYVIYATATIII